MRIFEPLEEFEFFNGDTLIGVYVPGMRYNCYDDERHSALSKALDEWIKQGLVKIVEEQVGTGPANIGGQGKVT